MYNALPGRKIAALVTHTLVQADDPAFARPTEFVGQVYPRDIARSLARKRGRHFAQDTTGRRRVVASPHPGRSWRPTPSIL